MTKSKRTLKAVTADLMAVVISITSVATQAAKATNVGQPCGTDVCDTSIWSIEDYANNIKDVYIMNYPESAAIITEIVDGYLNDDEFVAGFEETGGSVFLVVEEALHNVLDNSELSPIVHEGDSYYSIYGMPLIKQQSGHDDGAAAAVLMALYGCGVYDDIKDIYGKYTQQNDIINNITWNSDNKTTISEVTRILRKYYAASDNTSATFTFQTTCSSKFYTMMSLLTYSLQIDGVSIVMIPNGNSYYYAVVEDIYDSSEDDTQNIAIINPCKGEREYYTFDEFEKLLFPKSTSIVWMSVFCVDKSGEAIESVKDKYPIGSTFSGECDGGYQCAGFARYVFNEVKGRTYTSSINEATVTGFGNRTTTSRLDHDTSFTGVELDEATAKKYLQGLSTGAYVRFRLKSDVCHSVAVISTSDSEIKVYQANMDNKNTVMITTYKWKDFVNTFRYLLFFVD